MATQPKSHKIFVLAGSVCLVLAFLPWWSRRFPMTSSFVATPSATKISQSVFSIGVPPFPWFERINETKENPDGTVVYSNGSALYLACPSTLLGIAGVVMIVVSRRMLLDKEPA